jgi:hypothetical protein
VTLPIRWQESETLAVQGSQCTEVTLVKGEEPPSSVLPCGYDHAEVRQPDVKILISTF